ncbi:MAG: hypothetical protein HKN75_12010, partial [Bacteroidia bacterium]|nr:hypothetical protein [Bacteroidia bacterium]
NTGVMVFNNNEKIRELFNEWLRVYNEKIDVYPHDQTPFMEALMNKNIKLYVMQAIYNFRFPYLVTVPGLKVKLFHGRSNNFHALANKVNKKIKHRSWSPVSGLVYERVSTKAYLIGLIPKGVYSKYQQFKRLIGR